MSTGRPEQVSERVREAAAWVIGRARSVRIDEARIPAYAAELPARRPGAPDPETELLDGDGSRAPPSSSASTDQLGSGWWPTIASGRDAAATSRSPRA